MKVNKYGEPPVVIGQYNLDPKEMCFVQYLPISMSSKEKLGFEIRIPNNLKWTWPIVEQIVEYFGDNYVYLTVKHLYVTPNNMGNRPGWHTDGFGTDDVNYIWCDKYPTEFCVQDFNITDDCDVSLKEMEAQARSENIKTYGKGSLLRIDKYNVHRPPVHGEGLRTFIKISVSKDRYNLKGNAHNYLFDYDWEMLDREKERNHPSKV